MSSAPVSMLLLLQPIPRAASFTALSLIYEFVVMSGGRPVTIFLHYQD